MKSRIKGFATLAAVGLLVLTAALLAGAILSSQQILLQKSRADKVQEVKTKTWNTVEVLLKALQETWNADEQTLDVWWLGHSQAFPTGTTVVSLSGRVNLNTMTPFLLQDSELVTSLFGKSVEDFTTFRTNKGPFSRIEDYKDYFQPEALNQLYCTQSFFNVNTADEIMLEKVLAIRTGNESLASGIRASLRQFRTNKQILLDSDWDTLIAADKDSVGGLLGTAPELDVNTASPTILQALLRDPDFKLAQPDAKLQVLIAGRAATPWNPDTLAQALAVDKKSLLMQYLGTRCWFLQATLPEGSSSMTLVAVATYSTDSPPKVTFRILDTRWISL